MKAKRNIFITAVTFLFLISSCAVISFYPLYTEDVLKRDDRIIGKWSTIEEQGMHPSDVDTLIWEISFSDKKWVKKHNAPYDRGSHQVDNRYAYSLFVYYKSNPEDKVEFQLHLVDLEGKTYIDFYPEEWRVDNTILAFHLMGVHTFAKVDINDEYINIDWFDSDWFEQKLKENKIRIKHEKNSGNILLTAQPKDLQKFVIKYSDDENAFDDDNKFELKPIK
jgi:hypothetical protein